ncbi:hypothetical protein [Phaeodactylibacter xiamenensis]|uniref:Uncharacterized protein n=1 Tax=Phaeodactylibacter xiamenensis TaxID=1524460 RepID=A0A098S119_9BACT|nr:hypothetical protein [Phaeodactylibacter xiamenensis]KGE85528.1 hypothetical protein IX84_27140 [Phaeodactylibacter xiamenensis]
MDIEDAIGKLGLTGGKLVLGAGGGTRNSTYSLVLYNSFGCLGYIWSRFVMKIKELCPLAVPECPAEFWLKKDNA